ncbi:succinate dehydrogenase cytochrome b subunit [Desulfovermiculus halophilus]|jgi:succinate dehydrogenase / fumarate reductase cytochrome b subunit|uniref:succinate dehydrogenase cytochrome b subunit n=1 Tax=Desulfovermiculus halophilus TaxID=339722 RepID=UPI00048945F7|nr:succinate dehydrogenase cytochrome b subunit [Desulfovermiculus halophilus]
MILTEKTLARKILVGVSGIFLLLFIIGHMLGNTTIFWGPAGLNSYAHHVQSLGPLLWLERLIMLLLVSIHIYFGITLTLENRQSRSTKYVRRTYQRSTIFSRTMIYSGLVILAFIIYHLFHFTFQLTHPEISHLTDSAGRHDVYTMVVGSLQGFFVFLIYVIGLAALFFHLSHGVQSLFQTMGWNTDRTMPAITKGGRIAAVIIGIGFLAVPLAVFLRVLNI